MAVLGYNPNPGKEKIELSDGKWTVSIEGVPSTSTNEEINKKFMVTNNDTEEKYIVDGFKKKTKCEVDETNIWYSFDTNSGNFHIVPGGAIEIKIGCVDGKEKKITLIDKLDYIKKKLKAKEIHASVPKPKAKTTAVDNHRYVLAKREKNEYLMSFNRLWRNVKDDGTHICNNFGQAQFMCFQANKQINLPNGFKLMYPNSGKDGISEGKGRHLVFNAPYDINCGAEKIAKCFAEFIGLCEELCKKDKDGTINLKDDHEFIKWCEKSKECKKDETCKDNENCKEKREENEKITLHTHPRRR